MAAIVGTKVRGVEVLDRDFPEKPTGWPFKDPHDYMEGKRKDDGVPSHLWRIHDDYYDLHEFKHPGGDQWLTLTKGTDITELFEIHHLDIDRAKKILPAFHVPQEKPLPPRRSPFTFDTNGFYCTLRRKIWAKYGGKKRHEIASIGPSARANRIADVALLVSALLTCTIGMTQKASLAAAIAIFNGLFNGLFIGLGHNFLHQKDNYRRHYMNLSGFHSGDFRMHHALSHHAYTNTILDAEANSGRPHLDFFPGEKSLARAIAARAGMLIAFPLKLPLDNVGRFVRMTLGLHPASREDYLAQAVPLAQLMLLVKLRGSVMSAAALWTLMVSSTSTFFLWANFLLGPHFNDECWHQGDTLDSRDWGMLQVQTNTENLERAEHWTDNTLKSTIMNLGSFGPHHLHHLFPTIDGAYLAELVPVFEEHCEEWGVTFRTMSNDEMAKGLFKCVDGYPANDRTRNGVYPPRSKL